MGRGTSDANHDAPVTPTGTDPFTTDSLKKLQSTDERRLLDVVDKLRRTGLNGTIELPQLVVCGDQSSGKSSVLEAITEIPFPRKAGLCTRFATEIVLRRQPNSSVTIKINPSKLRTPAEQNTLSSFSKTITNLDELPDVIEDATSKMGLGKIGESAAFSRDILSVEISGPDRPQLTLVDLPGLIHSATKASTEDDKDLIFELVQEYMQNPRTIILAVVSAKNDAANQIILSLFKKIDSKGARTLGIITKPDCMSAGDEDFWFDLAANKEVFLQRGWHMLRNRTEGETAYTFAERNEAGQVFFDKGRFKNLPRPSVGIEALRNRLSTLLHRHLVQELPSLKREMEEKLKSTKAELIDLGERRETSQEQRIALTKVSTKIHHIIGNAINGQYTHTFFNTIDRKTSIVQGENVRRFRAVVQNLNQKFADDVRLRGHKFEIAAHKKEGFKVSQAAVTEVPPSGGLFGSVPAQVSNEEEATSSEEDGDSDSDSDASREEPEPMTHGEGLEWVKTMIRGCRGHELPGGVNPEVISHLFWEQSEPWKEIAEGHIEQVREACKSFIHQVLEFAAPSEFKKPLEDLVVTTVLEETLKSAQEELEKLLEDKARPPSTYNHYYSDTVQKRRHDKFKAMSTKARNIATVKNFGNNAKTFNADIFTREMEKAVERDMETFAAEEALESQHAIYKDKMKYFVTAITDQVIERCMIVPLPTKLFEPNAVAGMTDEEVAFVAAEPPETVAQRAFLDERKQMLERGFEIFREAMGGIKRGKNGR